MPGPTPRSAAFLSLLAFHTQCGTGKCLEPHLADGVAAGLADAVRAVIDPHDRVPDQDQVVLGVLGHRHLMVAFERVRANVGLVVTGTLPTLAKKVPDLLLDRRD